MLSLVLALTAAKPTVDVDTILREMTDLRLLAQRPDPWYRYRQWTSYDRNMANDPYANGDAGQFLRTEEHDGRQERVMADAKGPGAMVRLWSANPVGTIRFYFDGETKPRIETDMAALLSGKNPMFPEPFSYMASRGANLYFPMPYAQGLKVTWEGPSDVAIYYAVGTREYMPGTRVTTFVPASLGKAQRAIDAAARGLVPVTPNAPLSGGTVPAGGVLEAKFDSSLGGELYDFAVKVDATDDKAKPWEDPTQAHNVLRKLRVRMSFDGETTVDVPLGDFFGSAVGVTPFESLPISVKRDGTMVARWSMPFRRNARVWIENGNAEPVALSMRAQKRVRLFTPGTYLFHARWHSQTRSTRPMYDYTYADVKGEGRFVGVGLQVSNPVAAWWGEGDEKVSVDGEAFPSLFGTGTEDYFGYAWCDPTPFSRPYHAQPPTPNLGNMGQTQNSRYHIVDDVPFKTAVRFDMEAWHWADVACTYATTAYWYARPGTTLSEDPDPKTLLIPDAPLPKPVAGALEGEDLKWTVTGGFTEIQSGFPQLSGQRQFWWREPKVGAVATTAIRVPAAGRYEVFANLGFARDYGRFSVQVGSFPPKEMDFHQPDLEWKLASLGTFDLPVGETVVRFRALEANPKSLKGMSMLGVDYFLLEKR